MKSHIGQRLFRPENPALGFLPEGPTQLLNQNGKRTATLAWISIQHDINSKKGSLNLFDLDHKTNHSIELAGRPGFIAQSKSTELLYIGLEDRLILFDYESESVKWEGPHIIENSRTVINDGLPVNNGIFFGTKELSFNEPLAHLYFFDPYSTELSPLLGNQTCSNGKFYLDKSQQLYDIDTPSKCLVRYDFDHRNKSLSNKVVILDLTDRGDFPDGMRLAPSGKSAVIAFYNPNDVEFGLAQQFSLSSGDIEIEWQLPKSPRVTCPEFIVVDGHLKIMFTTADEGLNPSQQMLHTEAGSLFIADYPDEDLPETRPLVPLPSSF